MNKNEGKELLEELVLKIIELEEKVNVLENPIRCFCCNRVIYPKITKATDSYREKLGIRYTTHNNSRFFGELTENGCLDFRNTTVPYDIGIALGIIVGKTPIFKHYVTVCRQCSDKDIILKYLKETGKIKPEEVC